MSDERELVERLATIDATPRARWVAELRADLDAAWELHEPRRARFAAHDNGDTRRQRIDTVRAERPSPVGDPHRRRRGRRARCRRTRRLRPRRRAASRPAGLDRHRAPETPPRALFDTAVDEQLAPGTYFVDEVDGTSTPRIFVTIGTGWTNFDGSGLDKRGGMTFEDDIGFITFSRPDKVYLDACHLDDGFHPGPVATVDGLVAALREQQGGWVDVTAPSDISVDGYFGKTFQRTAPAVLSDCPKVLEWAHERSRG